jgi:hypothetical protein
MISWCFIDTKQERRKEMLLPKVFQQGMALAVSKDGQGVLNNAPCKFANRLPFIQGLLAWDQMQNPSRKPKLSDPPIPFSQLEPEATIQGLWLSTQGRTAAWD